MQGKVEMELELLTMEEAEQRPVGVGRDEPNQHPFLDEPKYVVPKKKCTINGFPFVLKIVSFHMNCVYSKIPITQCVLVRLVYSAS